MKFKHLLGIILFVQVIACNMSENKTEQLFFVGGYTSEEMQAEGKGISTCALNIETGEMSLIHSFE